MILFQAGVLVNVFFDAFLDLLDLLVEKPQVFFQHGTDLLGGDPGLQAIILLSAHALQGFQVTHQGL